MLTRNEYKDELIKSWKYCQEKKGLKIFAWCIMPSHVHMLIGSDDKPLEDIVRDMKSHTSTQIKKLIKEHPQESRREWMIWMFERAGKKNGNNADWQFWQQHNKPLEVEGKKCIMRLYGIFIKIPLWRDMYMKQNNGFIAVQKGMQKMMVL